VPPNVHVIGTMNTADRSLALVDYALRRRFAFAAVPPAFGPALRGFLQGTERGAPAEIVDKIFDRLARLNLGPGYLVGHSYFCQEDPDGAYGAAWYERIVRFEIAPLLEEYYAEDTDQVQRLVDELLS
jgi:5-methylcytosine-specific restriction protein B